MPAEHYIATDRNSACPDPIAIQRPGIPASLAEPNSNAAAELSGRGRVGTRNCRTEPFTANRDLLGSGFAQNVCLRRAQRGEAFILQGGDCAESFDYCTSESVVAKLKILLQMSLVMLYGHEKARRPGRAHGRANMRNRARLTSRRSRRTSHCPVTAETSLIEAPSRHRIAYQTRN